MQNIEIKYRIDQPHALREQLASLPAVKWVFRKQQRDIYFRVPEGRLKIRLETGSQPHLIEYYRPDKTRPRISDYRLEPLADPEAAIATLTARQGVLAEVRKTRELFLYKNVRIHLDEVAGLGWFLEFESVISEDCPREVAQTRLNEIIAILGTYLDQPQSAGYVNLLLQSAGKPQ